MFAMNKFIKCDVSRRTSNDLKKNQKSSLQYFYISRHSARTRSTYCTVHTTKLRKHYFFFSKLQKFSPQNTVHCALSYTAFGKCGAPDMGKGRDCRGDIVDFPLPTKFSELLSFYDLIDKFYCFARKNHIEFTVGVLKSFLKSCGVGSLQAADVLKSTQTLCALCGDISLSRAPNEQLPPRQVDIQSEDSLHILLNGSQGMSEVS